MIGQKWLVHIDWTSSAKKSSLWAVQLHPLFKCGNGVPRRSIKEQFIENYAWEKRKRKKRTFLFKKIIRISIGANAQMFNSIGIHFALIVQCFHLKLHFDLCSGYLVFLSFLFYSLFSSICSLHTIRLVIRRIDSAMETEIHSELNANISELDRFHRKNLHSPFPFQIEFVSSSIVSYHRCKSISLFSIRNMVGTWGRTYRKPNDNLCE